MEYTRDWKQIQQLDKEDVMREYRRMFFIPEKSGKTAIYLCGNSLGLQPKTTKFYIEEELRDWRDLGVEAHHTGKNAWVNYHHYFDAEAKLVGAKPSPIRLMNLVLSGCLMMRPSAVWYSAILLKQ